MINIVKITTMSGLAEMLCPHSCRGCGRRGKLLCECCKNYNSLGKLNYCPICHQAQKRGHCEECELPFLGTYMCGWRDELIGQMVEEYKYQSVRAMAPVLAEILDESLPEIKGEVIVVPLPTIARHVRERGFDHTRQLAKYLARRRGWKLACCLERAKNTVQVGVNAKKRRKQAAEAYKINQKLKAKATYLLLDDIWTTGASMFAAEKLLRKAGARKIIAAVVAVSR